MSKYTKNVINIHKRLFHKPSSFTNGVFSATTIYSIYKTNVNNVPKSSMETSRNPRSVVKPTFLGFSFEYYLYRFLQIHKHRYDNTFQDYVEYDL